MAALGDVTVRLRNLSPDQRRLVLARLTERREETARVAPLSYAQQRLWFLEQLAAGNPHYNETSAFRLLFPVDAAALRRSLNRVVERHEALRTVFEGAGGEPRQRVLRRLELELPVVDLGGMRPEAREAEAVRVAERQGREPFDLAAGPLLRVTLIRFSPSDFVLVLTMHHIVCDGWSMRILFDELRALYEGEVTGRPAELPELEVQYADFAAWQRRRLTGDVLDRQLGYWREQLAGLAPLELPADSRRRDVPTHAGARVPVRIPAAAYAGIRRLCDEEGATPFMALLACYQVFLHRYSGQADIAVGTPVANRSRPEDERLIGFFVNTVVMRTDLSGEPSFREALRRVKDAALAAYEHQDVPFERLVEELRPERDAARNPLFGVTFQMLRAPAAPAAASAALTRTVDVDLHTSKFDLRCDLWEDADGGVEGYLEYNLELFRGERAVAMARHLQTLVSGAAAAPDARIGELPLLTEEDERRVLVEFNRTAADFAGPDCVHRAFERCAERDGSRPAVVDARSALTYGELDSRSNQLARHLRERGVFPGSLVAVLIDRSVEYVLSIVAIVKAGGAYVPLDPEHPDDRLALLLGEASAQLVLTTRRHAAKLPARAQRVVVDADPGDWASCDAAGLPAQVDGQSLAYVVFTSGSTGRPKGVEVLHSGLRNLVGWHDAEYEIRPSDRATLYASPAFDASVWEMWPYLAAGASLWVPDERAHGSPGPLLAWMADTGITLSFLPTPVAEEVLEHELPAGLRLRALLTGGDRLRRPPASPLPFRFVNHYGPTESTVVATAADVGHGPADDAPPIGKPIANTQAFVLDRGLRPVPPGVEGELYLAGRSLARGYLGDAALTRERFVPNPFDPRPGSRMYRTGDLVRQRLDGTLEFRGRADRQLKVRGFRIEPADVEGALHGHPSVRKSLVAAYETPGGGTGLAAYVVPEPGAPDVAIADAQAERSEEWRKIYDGVYGADNPAADPAFDIVGWNSSYTGRPIPEADMREQVDGTVERLRELGPRRILEIGCGTGLLLLRMAAECERYLATDFSAPVVDKLAEECERRGLRTVELLVRAADDFSGIDEGGFDLVVLNSVVQYLPGMEQLDRVLKGAVRCLRPGGFLFVGDVRNLRLLPWFHAGVQLASARDDMSAGELRERVEEAIANEQELVIDPAFFLAWAAATPEVGGVRVEVRRGRRHNEITKFRYDAVLRTGRGLEETRSDEDRDWNELPGTAAWAAHLGGRRGVLRLRRVPSARLAGERRLMDLLTQTRDDTRVEALRREVAAAAGGVEPEDLWALERDGAYAVRVAWSGPAAEGTYDVCCVPRGAGLDRPWDVPPEAPEDPRPWSAYANDVLGRCIERMRSQALRNHLRQSLPDHMVPTRIVWTDRLPLTPNGKFDRASLPAAGGPERTGIYVSPRGDLEERIASVWSEVLGLDRIGAETNFFDLGGHSLLLVKVHNRLSELRGGELSVVDLFRYPTVRSLAAAMTAD